MEEKPEGYFSDKKNWVSLIAVGISTLALMVAATSLWWTYHNQQDQNHRWDVLNLPRVELSDVGFIIWKELSADEALKTDWGYKATILTKLEKRIVQKQYQIPYELVLYDVESSKIIPGSVSFFTVAKGNEEMKRLGLENRLSKIQFYKHYRVEFDFKNMGTTSAKELQVRADRTFLGRSINQGVLFPPSQIELAPNNICNVNYDFHVPLDIDFPTQIEFDVVIEYKDPRSQPISRKIPVVYDSAKATWSYANSAPIQN